MALYQMLRQPPVMEKTIIIYGLTQKEDGLHNSPRGAVNPVKGLGVTKNYDHIGNKMSPLFFGMNEEWNKSIAYVGSLLVESITLQPPVVASYKL